MSAAVVRVESVCFAMCIQLSNHVYMHFVIYTALVTVRNILQFTHYDIISRGSAHGLSYDRCENVYAIERLIIECGLKI